MPKNNNQLNKSLAILQLLLSRTDDDHVLNARDIETLLYDAFGIEAEYRSILRDINQLKELFDTEVDNEYIDQPEDTSFNYYLEYDARNDKKGYHIIERPISQQDAQLIINAIIESKNISSKSALRLIETIASTRSMYEKTDLISKNDVYVYDRSEQDNEKLIKILNQIRIAMECDHQISYEFKRDERIDKLIAVQTPDIESLFSGKKLDLVKKLLANVDEANKNRKPEVISPYRIVMFKGDYYLIGVAKETKFTFDQDGNENNKIEETIVLKNIHEFDYVKDLNEKRIGKDLFLELDVREFLKTRKFKPGFNKLQKVKIRFKRDYYVAKDVADTFGIESILPLEDKKSEYMFAEFEIEEGYNDLCSWLFSHGSDIQIIEPKEIREKYKRQLLLRLNDEYLEDLYDKHGESIIDIFDKELYKDNH